MHRQAARIDARVEKRQIILRINQPVDVKRRDRVIRVWVDRFHLRTKSRGLRHGGKVSVGQLGFRQRVKLHGPIMHAAIVVHAGQVWTSEHGIKSFLNGLTARATLGKPICCRARSPAA